jgi:hypothetical protein
MTNTVAYMQGRQQYQRPQAIVFSNNPGTLVDGHYIPVGVEGQDFIILSDDNRGPIDFTTHRIEKRERMVNGHMRSYHIADKLTLSTSWNLLPSRSYASQANFNSETGKSSQHGNQSLEYTTDGGAGGVEILDWYENHYGSFWVFLAYDKYTNFENVVGVADPYANLNKYNQILEVYFADFTYNVQKRGAANFDFWNINFTLEEA